MLGPREQYHSVRYARSVDDMLTCTIKVVSEKGLTNGARMFYLDSDPSSHHWDYCKSRQWFEKHISGCVHCPRALLCRDPVWLLTSWGRKLVRIFLRLQEIQESMNVLWRDRVVLIATTASGRSRTNIELTTFRFYGRGSRVLFQSYNIGSWL